MEEKVGREFLWDRDENEGRILKGVLGVVIRHTEGEWTEEEFDELAEVVGNDAWMRLIEWRNLAIQHVSTLPDEERIKLGWVGSEVVTDINQFRANKDR